LGLALMIATPISLLERLKLAKPDASDWQRLQEIYPPLIRSLLARVPGIRDEIEDITQEVLVVLLREMSSFERRRDGSFRAWLRQVTVNRVRAFQKARQRRPIAGLGEAAELLLAQLEDSDSTLARQWDQEYDTHVFQKLLVMVRGDFEPNTWKAFQRFAVDGLPAARVAGELGISESAVVQA